MSCREHAREIHRMPQAWSEEITTTGSGNTIYMNRIPKVKDFRTIMLYINLPDGESAGAGNLPIAIKAWAVGDTGDAAGTRQLILEKCLTDVTGWSGHAFLEINETHIGRFADYGDYEHLYFSIEGPDTIVYEAIVVLADPVFQSPDNVLEAFTK